MSQTAAKQNARRWLATAHADFEAARSLRAAGHHAHACFMAQQAAEKAVKALWHWHDVEPWGHSILKLLREAPSAISFVPDDALLRAAADLDK
ncbi:MAG: HEPN domain-containing protein [Verrucomicrobiae bacterium]|nr:HEPN domain-containing protein [Verrucomicrobiae bacterium]